MLAGLISVIGIWFLLGRGRFPRIFSVGFGCILFASALLTPNFRSTTLEGQLGAAVGFAIIGILIGGIIDLILLFRRKSEPQSGIASTAYGEIIDDELYRIAGEELLSDDDELYKIAGEELLSDNVKPGIWARALTEAEDDQQSLKAAYVRLRVEQLRSEQREIQEASAPPVCSQSESQPAEESDSLFDLGTYQPTTKSSSAPIVQKGIVAIIGLFALLIIVNEIGNEKALPNAILPVPGEIIDDNGDYDSNYYLNVQRVMAALDNNTLMLRNVQPIIYENEQQVSRFLEYVLVGGIKPNYVSHYLERDSLWYHSENKIHYFIRNKTKEPIHGFIFEIGEYGCNPRDSFGKFVVVNAVTALNPGEKAVYVLESQALLETLPRRFCNTITTAF